MSLCRWLLSLGVLHSYVCPGKKCVVGHFLKNFNSVGFCGSGNRLGSSLITSLLLCDVLARAVTRLIMRWSARDLSSPTAVEMQLSPVVQCEAWSAHKFDFWFNALLLLSLANWIFPSTAFEAALDCSTVGGFLCEA